MNTTDSINYWAITLKSYVSCWVETLTLKEKYGEEDCPCNWNNVILATCLIKILECYTVLSYVSGAQGDLGDDPIDAETTTVLSDTCYTEANELEIKKIFQIASGLINKKS